MNPSEPCIMADHESEDGTIQQPCLKCLAEEAESQWREALVLMSEDD